MFFRTIFNHDHLFHSVQNFYVFCFFFCYKLWIHITQIQAYVCWMKNAAMKDEKLAQ